MIILRELKYVPVSNFYKKIAFMSRIGILIPFRVKVNIQEKIEIVLCF